MKNVILATAALGALSCLGVTISIDKVQQRYPWNGLVDIDYAVSYAQDEAPFDVLTDRLVFLAIDCSTSPATTNVARRVDCGIVDGLAAGTRRATWDAYGDGVTNVVTSSLVIRAEVRHCAEKYLVVDVSGGQKATSYPYEFRAAPPATKEGFNCDEYKGDKIVFRYIPQGTFLMGSGTSARLVTLTRPFYIGLFELTQKQYYNVKPVDASKPNSYVGDFRPMDGLLVSHTNIRGSGNWPNSAALGADSFLGRLSARTGLSFDLPTAAQWEYACRAGTTTKYNDGDDTSGKSDAERMNLLGRYASNGGDGKGGYMNTTKVGSYLPNAWGLYDMHGNVGEWCLDATGGVKERFDPVGGQPGRRIICGGNHQAAAASCTSASFVDGYAAGNSETSGKSGARIVMLPE